MLLNPLELAEASMGPEETVEKQTKVIIYVKLPLLNIMNLGRTENYAQSDLMTFPGNNEGNIEPLCDTLVFTVPLKGHN